MTGVQAQGQAKSMSIEATVIRADGRVEPLGIIMQTHRSPLMRLWQRITRRFRKPTMTRQHPEVEAAVRAAHARMAAEITKPKAQ